MECPNCKHVASPTSLVKCSNCGTVLERQCLEEYEHIGYLRRWLIEHRQKLGGEFQALEDELAKRTTELVQIMQLDKSTQAATPPVPELKKLGEEQVQVAAPIPTEDEYQKRTESEKLVPAAALIVASTPTPALAPAASRTATRPAHAPRRPARPPIEWGKIWDRAVNFVVSGALLRALLYLGAFMIVVSAAVLVINFWEIFPPLMQVAFIFALPTAFYAAGWLTRSRLKLAQAGMVLTGVGAILLGVDFAALYQFSNLDIDLEIYWLFAALITTAIYIFTAYRLQGEFFDYLALLGGVNILVPLTRLLNAPLEWSLASIPAAGLGMVGLAAWAWPRGETWRDAGRAARYLPQVLVPLSLVAILFNWESNSQAARATAFLFAALAYGMLAWKFPAVQQVILALASMAVAVGYGVLTIDSGGLWLATAAAVLSAVYILSGWDLLHHEGAFPLRKSYRLVFDGAGYALALTGVLGSLVLASGGYRLQAAIPLTLVGLSFCAWNLLLAQPLWGYFGSGLLLLAAWYWFDLAHLPGEFYPLAFLLLISFAYLPAGMLVRRRGKKFAAPFEWSGWLVAGLVFLATFLTGTPRYQWAPALTLTLLAAYMGFNAWQFRYAIFSWGATFVFLAAATWWMVLWKVLVEQMSIAWVGLALVYMLVERFFKRLEGTIWAKPSFRLPLRVGIAVLISTGVITAIVAYFEHSGRSDRQPVTLVAQGLAIGLIILAARVYRSRWPLFFEPPLSALLAVFFFLSYSSDLFGKGLRWYEYGLVLCGAAWLHLLVAAGMDRLRTRYAHGLYLGGYGLLILGVMITLTTLPSLLWALGGFILAMGASAVLVHFNHHHTWNDLARLLGKPEQGRYWLVRSAFVWLAGWLLPVWCVLLLVQLEAPNGLLGLGLSLPAVIYLAAGLRLAKHEKLYSRALYSAAHVFSLAALLFSIDRVLIAGLRIASGLALTVIHPAALPGTISQGIVLLSVVIFYAAWGWVKHQRFFSHVAAWLSILPFTSLLLALRVVSAKWVVVAWAGWAALLLVVGFLLDRLGKAQPRHAHGPYLAGYTLAILTLLVSAADRWLNTVVLGICIACAAGSFVALHFKRHASFEDLINFFWYKETLIRRGAHMLFLFFAAYALPVWMVQLEAYFNVGHNWQGVSLALLAPLYIATGLLLRRLNTDYTWPFYSAGYAMSAIGAVVAFADQRLAVYVLVLDIAVYAASAAIFRKPFWLYLATCLTPFTVLVALDYNNHLTPPWIAWSYTVLGFLYFGLGQLLERRKSTKTGIASFTMACYIPGFVLSAIALLVVWARNDRPLALVVFPANILLYALSAWRLRQKLFLYPAAWLSTVPYYLFARTYFAIPLEWEGAAWLPLILVFIALGRFVFQKTPVNMKTPGAILTTLIKNPAMPFYTIGYVLSVIMVSDSRQTWLTLTVGSGLATLLYFASALLFRHPAWLYPTLFTAHLSVISYFAIDPSGSPARMVSIPFLALTWLEAIAGYIVSRRYPVTQMTSSGRLVFKLFNKQVHFGEFPAVGFLTIPSWAQPIFIFVALDTLAWESVALTGLDTGVWVSAGFFLLFALLSLTWRDQLLAHLSLALGITAIAYQLSAQGLTLLQIFASLSGIGFLLYLLSWLVEFAGGVVQAWRKPLLHIATGVAGLSLLATLPTIFSETISTAFALGFNGAIYLTMSLRRRTYLLGYFGMGLLLAGWSLFLFVRNVEQPQLYAIPAGLYFVGMGFFERARRPGRFALMIETLGLALLLITSFVQSVDGEKGFPYFLLLFVESLLVIWWGAARRLRVPFIIGLAASVVNVLAQVVVLVSVYDVNRWVIIFGAGILLVGLGLFVERRREMLLARAQELRDILERWD